MQFCVASLIASVLVWALPAQAPSAPQTSASHLGSSCKEFVQGFYDWYVPYAASAPNQKHALPTDESALQRRKASFDPNLVRLLMEEYNAQARSRKIVGIDFNPFLGGNAVLPHEVGAAKIAGKTCFIDVYTIESGKKFPRDVTTPELSFRTGKWIFLNFHYRIGPDGNEFDLLRLLEAFRSKGEI